MRESELKGKRVTVVGRSLVVGKPLAMLMLGQHATVTICHTSDRGLYRDLPEWRFWWLQR